LGMGAPRLLQKKCSDPAESVLERHEFLLDESRD